MKRMIFILILATLIVFSLSVSIAEDSFVDFVLRNEIHFGDSIEDVMEKEQLNLTDTTSTKREDNHVTYTSESTVIAGIDDSKVTYEFDENGLIIITYSFREGLKGEMEAVALARAFDFDNIDDGLTIKYGEPMGENDEFADIDSDLQHSMDSLIALQKFLSKGKKSSFGKTGTERVVPFNDGIVKIEHYIYVIDKDLTYHRVQYICYTNEQIGRKQAPRNPGSDVVDDL